LPRYATIDTINQQRYDKQEADMSVWTWVGIGIIVVLIILFFVVRRKR
jgi:LPXTG-motif cell wall-anchored protein